MTGGVTTTMFEGMNMWWQRVSTDGDPSYSAVYDDAAHYSDYLADVAFDASGRFYVIGHVATNAMAQQKDIWLRKHDADGEEMWTRTFDGGAEDDAQAIAVGDDDQIVVVGSTQIESNDYDVWVRKYSAEGGVVWTDVHAGAAGGRDRGGDVAVGDDLSVAVIGTEGDDIWVRKYGANGTVQWTATYDGPAIDCSGKCFQSDTGNGIALDSHGAVIAVGLEIGDGPGMGDDSWVRKYDSAGAELWTKVSDPDGSAIDTAAEGVAVAADDSILVIGSSRFNDSGAGWVQKYAP